MDLGESLVADSQTMEIMEPSMRTFDCPSILSESAAVLSAALGELGNGNYESGDGWRYRGRGMKQLTGRANYHQFTKWNENNQTEWPEDVADYEKNPDMLTQSKYAARSAAYFWVENNLPVLADKGATAANVNAITAIVNLHTDSYAARVKNFETIHNRGDLN